MANQVNGYSYNRNQVKAGILHFGVGNFHRAHLEYMTNKLLENETQQQWGICGAMILPGDDRLYHALKKQQGEYTLTVCGRDDSINVYKNRCARRTLLGYRGAGADPCQDCQQGHQDHHPHHHRGRI